MRIVIQGSPIAKKRPRFARVGKGIRTYNPQETEEGRWLWEARQQITGKPLVGPIRLTCLFVMPRPASHYGTGKNAEFLKKSAPPEHIKKPDLDNLIKWVKDCLNGEAWKDDSQVVEIGAAKMYVESSDDTPRTIIHVAPWSLTQLCGIQKSQLQQGHKPL